MNMTRTILVILTLITLLGCAPSKRKTYSIDKAQIENYRTSPVTDVKLLNIIRSNDHFINKDRNPYISEATLEHHLIEKSNTDQNTTYIVFEYFSLEGVYCDIKAVTTNKQGKLISIIQLAELSEYVGGVLNGSSILEKDIATVTTVQEGVKEYVDSTDQIIMQRDCTIVSYQLNQFQKIEVIDSISKHYQFVK